MYNFYWLKLDLPQLPDNLRNEFYNCHDNPVINISTDRVLTKGDKQFTNGYLARYKVDFHNWVKENITDKYHEISAQIIEKGASIGPHTDRYRYWHLYYILDAGGDNVETVWFQEKGKPVWRDECVVLSDYNQLTELHRAILPTNTWILFSSRIVHDVQNITGTRNTITVDLYEMPERFLPLLNQ